MAQWNKLHRRKSTKTQAEQRELWRGRLKAFLERDYRAFQPRWVEVTPALLADMNPDSFRQLRQLRKVGIDG